jgi:hypothetical protein
MGFGRADALLKSSRQTIEPEAQVSLVQKSIKLAQKLRNLIHELNGTFAWLLLLNCARDMMAMAAIIALFLRRDDPQSQTETRANFERRVYQQNLKDSNIYSFTFLTVGVAVLRIVVCICCHEQVRLPFLLFYKSIQ